MVNKSKLSKDVEEQIQSLASDVYIQIEDKLTKLISSAIETDNKKDVNKQNDDYSDLDKRYKTSQLELSEQIDLSNNKSQSFEQEINALKNTLTEAQGDLETNKQNFQVELTQNNINFTETIEDLEKKIVYLQQEKNSQQSKQQINGSQLEEKLLETEQALKDSKKEVDGLNGRITVLTEQEKSLTKQISSINELKGNEDNKLKATLEKLQQTNKEQSETLVKKQQVLEETIQKLNAFSAEVEKVQKDSQLSNDSKAQEIQAQMQKLSEQLQQEKDSKVTLQQEFSEKLQQEKDSKAQEIQAQMQKLSEQLQQEKDSKITLQQEFSEKLQQEKEREVTLKQELADKLQQEQESKVTLKKEFTEQLQQEHDNKVTLQENLTELQKSIDTQQDKNQQLEANTQGNQEKIALLIEELSVAKATHIEENKAITVKAEEAKHLQVAARQAIIELEKNKAELTKSVETEQRYIQLYQQEALALKDELKVAQDAQENILQRFNSTREKQEQDNEKVRETIKFLRDENHDLLGSHAEQNTQLTEQIHDLEHKLTEYRLKFEYAQKQLAN